MAENKFQRIKRLTREYEERTGKKAIRLSIGQPAGPALSLACRTTSGAVLSRNEVMHEYQDNGSSGVPDFAERFVQAHLQTTLPRESVMYAPIPGIKPMFGPVIQAMGGWREGHPTVRVKTLTNPGYPTPADQCAYQNNVAHEHMAIHMEGEPFSSLDIGEYDEHTLIMLNFPHNPTGRVMTERGWYELCDFCQEARVTVVNDAAYAILANSGSCLAPVAAKFPSLQWMEMYSASKAGNFTGWRVGAAVGSVGFMHDFLEVKGNTDSGFAAPMAAGIIGQFEMGREEIFTVRDAYLRRLKILNETLGAAGMQLATPPVAGFFALYKAPKWAFGQEIADGGAFNSLLIERTGIVGVDFGEYVRYAVCAVNIEEIAPAILTAFQSADVRY